MPTTIGPILQSGTVRSAPLQSPRAIERATGDDFRASLDEKVRGRETPTVEPEARSEAPDRTESVDAEQSATSDGRDSGAVDARDASDPLDSRDDAVGDNRDETAPPRDETEVDVDGDAEGDVVAGAAAIARSVTAGAEASATGTAGETTSKAAVANTNASTDGAVPRQAAQSQELSVGPAAAQTQDGAAQDGSDLSGEQSLNGKSAALDLSGTKAADASDAKETTRFADRLAARIGEQSAGAQATEARGHDGAARPAAVGEQATTAGLKTTLAAATRTDGSAVQVEQVDDRASVASVNRGMSAVVKQNGGSVTIKLSPESLGPLKIQMSIEGGRVDLRFDAATEQARDMLTRNADMLRQSLQNKGLGVERLQVHTAQATTESADGRGAQQRQDSQEQQHRQDASREQSRGYSDRRGGNQGEQQGWREQSETFSSAWRVALNATA